MYDNPKTGFRLNRRFKQTKRQVECKSRDLAGLHAVPEAARAQLEPAFALKSRFTADHHP